MNEGKINVSAELTLEADKTVINVEHRHVFKFNLGTGFYYSQFSKIIAQGTATEPIIFTSSKSSRQIGDRYGIYFYSGSEGSI